MIRTIVPITAVFLLLTACGAKKPAEQEQSTEQGADGPDSKAAAGDKLVTAQISGDRSDQINATGELASVAMIGGTGKTLVTINGTRDDGEDKGVTVSVMVGAPALTELVRHSATVDTGIGSVSFKPVDSTSEYSTMFYPQFYAAGPKGAPAIVRFEKVTKLSAEPMMARYHVVGSFEFQAAAHPDPLSDACVTEAVKATAAQRNPGYNAALCGAKRITVRGRFDSKEYVLEKK